MIEPRYATLQTLFADRVFRIPHYQRFYSWKTKQREDLFEDLKRLGERRDDNHHFMATIVCHRTGEVKPVGATEYHLYDIVDGQQRLTTLILILKCIEQTLEDDSEERVELSKILVKRDGHLILLQTNNTNDHIFNAFLREGQQPAAADIHTHADRNLRQAMCACSDFVEDWKATKGDIMSLLRLMTNRLGFVVYDTADRRIVYSIFEVLNSRGLVVDWLDRCKSVLMGRAFELAQSDAAAEAVISSLQNLWGNIYREIATVSVSGEEILRVTATIHYGPSQSKPRKADESIELLREECDEADKPRQIAERIYDVTRKLVALEKNIFLGPVTRILQARILAVALESAECLTEREREKALAQWERVTFRIFGLYGRDARTKVGDYIRLAASVANREPGASRYSEIMESLGELGEDFPAATAVQEGLVNTDCYESPNLCRYVLWRYEEHLARTAGRGATVDEQVRRDIWQLRSVDSIEHMFPQTPESGGAWEGKMCRADGIAQEYWRHVDRIGNLILLPLSLNWEAKRRGFVQKKEVYERHNLRMVREILDEADWTLAEIEKREGRIVEWAKTEWDDLKTV